MPRLRACLPVPALPVRAGAASPPWRRGSMAAVGIAMALTFGSSHAGAAGLSGLMPAPGLLAAIVAWLLLQGWPEPMTAAGLTGGVGMLLLTAAALWLWRANAATRHTAAADVRRPPLAAPRSQVSVARVVTVALPAGVERAPMLGDLRRQFVRLQAAWDRGEVQALRALTLPEMLDELCLEWPGVVQGASRTDVVTLHAELLGYEELAGSDLVTVEFSGLIREVADQGAVPFRELWMLARSNQGNADWKLARHQTLI
ncbi:MAG: TIM44-like domain-containing protein [Burkholderiaceae bacterium]